MYKRILLKISGESLAGPEGFGIEPKPSRASPGKSRKSRKWAWRWRWSSEAATSSRACGLPPKGWIAPLPTTMGMLATIINALALQNFLEKIGAITRVHAAIEIQQLRSPSSAGAPCATWRRGALSFSPRGTGNPIHQRHSRIPARRGDQRGHHPQGDALDGVYDSDPEINPSAKLYERLSYLDVIKNQLKVMDATS